MKRSRTTIFTYTNIFTHTAIATALGMCFAAGSTTQAGLITPSSAVASSRFFNDGRDDPANLIGPGLTVNDPIETSTHENSQWNNTSVNGHWFGNTSASITLDFDLGGTFTIEKAHIWNYNGAPDATAWGAKDITLIFSQDATFGNGDDVSQLVSLVAASQQPDYTGEHFPVASLPGVTNIRLDITSKLVPGIITGLSEVRFSGNPIPEPSTMLLSTLGLLGLAVRRRKWRQGC